MGKKLLGSFMTLFVIALVVLFVLTFTHDDKIFDNNNRRNVRIVLGLVVGMLSLFTVLVFQLNLTKPRQQRTQ